MLDGQGTELRPETRPMCFEGDWTGVFIRGDDAFGYITTLRNFLKLHPPTDNESVLESNCRHDIEELIGLLHSSHRSSSDTNIPKLKLPVQGMKDFTVCKK